MRTHHATALLAAAGLLALTACGPPATDADKPGSPAPSGPAATTPSGSGPGPGAGTAEVPNLVGKGLQAAQDEAQAAGFLLLTSHDSLGRGRAQVLDRGWKVCTQTPAAGTRADTGTTLDFGAVKLEESCPAKDVAPPTEARGTMPNLIGQSMKAARSALPANAGITVKDASPQGRVVVVESNWRVCTQNPPTGTPLDGRPAIFHVVKFEETCP